MHASWKSAARRAASTQEMSKHSWGNCKLANDSVTSIEDLPRPPSCAEVHAGPHLHNKRYCIPKLQKPFDIGERKSRELE